MKNDPISEEQQNKMVDLFNQGMGGRLIAKQLGLKHPATITKVLKRHGLVRPMNWQIKSTKDRVWSFQKNNEALRKAAEQYARFYFVLHGAIVHVPDSNAPYDLLVSSKELGENKKIQVKTSYSESNYGGYQFALIKSRSNSKGTRKVNYIKDDCDYFFLMDIDGNTWLIPFKDVGVRAVCAFQIEFVNSHFFVINQLLHARFRFRGFPHQTRVCCVDEASPR